MKIIGKHGTVITTVESWFDAAPPKGGKKQWVSGYSAKELAQAWCGSGKVVIPAAMKDLLASAGVTRDMVLLQAWPEKRVRFDRFPGESRNVDLAIVGLQPDGSRVAISIEAKAKEPFDGTVYEKLAAALKRIAREQPSNFPSRVHQLGRALFQPHKPGDPPLGEIRYQLLAATAGALAFANQAEASAAVLVIHEFGDLDLTEAEKQNAADLDVFVKRLSGGQISKVSTGVFHGPINVPGAAMIPGNVPLWVGKIRTFLTSEGHRHST
jgi:hypothetical protein